MTETRLNELGQPIGRELDWAPAQAPEPRTFTGRHVRLEPLNAVHAADLFKATGRPPSIWTYLPLPLPSSAADMAEIIEQLCAPDDWLPFLVRSSDGSALGTLSYLRIQPDIGTIEVGAVIFGPDLQRTPASTEAHYLLMSHAFEDLGYRRYEWKCDSLNAPSRRAAARLGFVEEGTWRNAGIYKGRNRDTTWLSITIEEWPGVKAAFEAWLARDNFEHGKQIRRLADFRQTVQDVIV